MKQTSKVMICFNDEDPIQIATLTEGYDFSLNIKQPEPKPEIKEDTNGIGILGTESNSNIQFSDGKGRTFTISVELIED